VLEFFEQVPDGILCASAGLNARELYLPLRLLVAEILNARRCGAYTEATPRKAGGNEEARNLVAAGDHGKGVRRRVRGYSFGWRPIDRSPTNLLGLSRSPMRPRRQLSFS